VWLILEIVGGVERSLGLHCSWKKIAGGTAPSWLVAAICQCSEASAIKLPNQVMIKPGEQRIQDSLQGTKHKGAEAN
jgi:hypothetical protein